MSMSDYRAAVAQVKKARQDAKRAMHAAFSEACAGLFKAHPELTSFAWQQYTPYFNDGDACEFSARVEEPDINEVSGYDIDEGWTDREGNKRGGEHAALVPLQEAVAELLQEFDQEDLKEMFGDHMTVTVTPDGITTDDCEHD